MASRKGWLSMSPTVPPISVRATSAPADARADGVLDRVGDVRDDLHGRAQVVAAALARDHLGVDLARGEVAGARELGVRVALVVAEVEVRFRAVVENVDLSVLEGAHRARIHVDVGVELLHRHLQPALLEDHADRGRGQALAQAGDHSAGDEDVLDHGQEASALSRRRWRSTKPS